MAISADQARYRAEINFVEAYLTIDGYRYEGGIPGGRKTTHVVVTRNSSGIFTFDWCASLDAATGIAAKAREEAKAKGIDRTVTIMRPDA